VKSIEFDSIFTMLQSELTAGTNITDDLTDIDTTVVTHWLSMPKVDINSVHCEICYLARAKLYQLMEICLYFDNHIRCSYVPVYNVLSRTLRASFQHQLNCTYFPPYSNKWSMFVHLWLLCLTVKFRSLHVPGCTAHWVCATLCSTEADEQTDSATACSCAVVWREMRVFASWFLCKVSSQYASLNNASC